MNDLGIAPRDDGVETSTDAGGDDISDSLPHAESPKTTTRAHRATRRERGFIIMVCSTLIGGTKFPGFSLAASASRCRDRGRARAPRPTASEPNRPRIAFERGVEFVPGLSVERQRQLLCIVVVEVGDRHADQGEPEFFDHRSGHGEQHPHRLQNRFCMGRRPRHGV